MGGCESYGKQWNVGDVAGVFLDLVDRTISKSFITLMLSQQKAPPHSPPFASDCHFSFPFFSPHRLNVAHFLYFANVTFSSTIFLSSRLNDMLINQSSATLILLEAQ